MSHSLRGKRLLLTLLCCERWLSLTLTSAWAQIIWDTFWFPNPELRHWEPSPQPRFWLVQIHMLIVTGNWCESGLYIAPRQGMEFGGQGIATSLP